MDLKYLKKKKMKNKIRSLKSNGVGSKNFNSVFLSITSTAVQRIFWKKKKKTNSSDTKVPSSTAKKFYLICFSVLNTRISFFVSLTQLSNKNVYFKISFFPFFVTASMSITTIVNYLVSLFSAILRYVFVISAR